MIGIFLGETLLSSYATGILGLGANNPIPKIPDPDVSGTKEVVGIGFNPIIWFLAILIFSSSCLGVNFWGIFGLDSVCLDLFATYEIHFLCIYSISDNIKTDQP